MAEPPGLWSLFTLNSPVALSGKLKVMPVDCCRYFMEAVQNVNRLSKYRALALLLSLHEILAQPGEHLRQWDLVHNITSMM